MLDNPPPMPDGRAPPQQTSSARETVRSSDQRLSDARVASRMSSIVHDH